MTTSIGGLTPDDTQARATTSAHHGRMSAAPVRRHPRAKSRAIAALLRSHRSDRLRRANEQSAWTTSLVPANGSKTLASPGQKQASGNATPMLSCIDRRRRLRRK
jgi:hypothetical protein